MHYADLDTLRANFLERIYRDTPKPPPWGRVGHLDLLKAILAQRHTVELLAKYTHDVLKLFDAVPML
ncbi:hypothetical protein BD779DRAFT_1520444, partial [Infundibulicybe gibba]